jgi:hypothetical protein
LIMNATQVTPDSVVKAYTVSRFPIGSARTFVEVTRPTEEGTSVASSGGSAVGAGSGTKGVAALADRNGGEPTKEAAR